MNNRKEKLISIFLGLYAASTLISMATMSIGVLFLVLASGLSYSPDRFRAFHSRRIVRTYAVLTTLLFLGLMISITRQKFFPFAVFGNTFEPQYWDECKKFMYFLNPLLLAFTLFDKKKEDLYKLLSSQWMTLGLLSIIGVQQIWTGLPKTTNCAYLTSEKVLHCSTLWIGLTHSLTSNYVLVFFSLLAAFFVRVKIGIFGNRFLHFFTLLVSFLTLIGTFSRWIWFTIPIGLAVLISVRLPKKVALLFLILGTLFVLLLDHVPLVHNRVHYKYGYEDRIVLWNGNIELFKQHPILGVGWRQSSKLVDGAVKFYYGSRGEKVPGEYFQSHAHNTYLETLSSTGLVGLALFLIWNLWILAEAWKGLKDPEWGWWFSGFIAGMIVVHLNGITQVNFWDSKVFHQIMFQFGIFLLLKFKQNKII